ncbi:UBX domain-containing protein 8 isoform X2 [Microcaecilia unicolor]|uniref:UBX domain-containing protein 8 isoform X2 n=1 Tax=Microcaecilia unicolor TaxID=1415580 RepID=A0A6P7X420_9AMPH|nr:UBX domain-containing protein 8 isoform X2 [Microcaecilia unicolor]
MRRCGGAVMPALAVCVSAAAVALGLRSFILLAGRLLLVLALLTLIISVVIPWFQSYSLTQARSSLVAVPEDEQERRQRLARKEQQERLSEKTSYYLENVIKPREEMKLRKQEEHFYQMTGQNWKLTQGQRLGEDESVVHESGGGEMGLETPSKEALRKRKLPEHATKPAPPSEPVRQKKGLVLPEEPMETTEGVVTVALRCPSGRVFRRRFLKSFSSQVLLDWMMKLGYHTAIYTLCTPYPRRHLKVGHDLTLEHVGIATDTVLNVEETIPCD